MISIIVPIYNVEKYLSKCIDSILAQTYNDIEVILVDDGSPDNCPMICDEYAQKDNRVIVIHQKNAGVSAARNAGLKVAQGEYIGFVDADDYINENMYSEMISAFQKYSVELAICGYNYVNENGDINREYNCSDVEVVNQYCVYYRYFDIPPTIRLGVCNKLFKRNLLMNLLFSESIKGAEDAEFLAAYISKIKNAAIIHKPLYFNCERTGSATRGGLKADAVLPALDIYYTAKTSAINNYPEISNHAQAYCLDACLLNYEVYCKKNISENKSVIKQIKYRMRKEFPRFIFNRDIFWKTRIMYILFIVGFVR